VQQFGFIYKIIQGCTVSRTYKMCMCVTWSLCTEIQMSTETCNVRIVYYWSAFAEPLLLWKSNKYYIFFVCVFTAIGTQHTMRMLHIIICVVSGPVLFFQKYKIKVTEHKNVYFDFLSRFYPKYFLFSERSSEIWSHDCCNR
jgi:hypothetical protein